MNRQAEPLAIAIPEFEMGELKKAEPPRLERGAVVGGLS